MAVSIAADWCRRRVESCRNSRLRCCRRSEAYARLARTAPPIGTMRSVTGGCACADEHRGDDPEGRADDATADPEGRGAEQIRRTPTVGDRGSRW